MNKERKMLKSLISSTGGKVNSPEFPVLSCIAKDVHVVPVSTVASKSTFSVSGKVLDSFRSLLTPKVVEALICGQGWIRAAPLPSVEENVDDVEKLEAGKFSLYIMFYNLDN